MGCVSSKKKNPSKDQGNNPTMRPSPDSEGETQKEPLPSQRGRAEQPTTPQPQAPRAPIKPKPAPGTYSTSKPITLKVEDLRMQAHTVQATPGLKVQELYAQIQGNTGKNPSDFAIFFTGRLLPYEENGTIGEYGVTADSTLDLINKPK